MAENTGIRSRQLVYHEPALTVLGGGDKTSTHTVKAARIRACVQLAPGSEHTPPQR